MFAKSLLLILGYFILFIKGNSTSFKNNPYLGNISAHSALLDKLYKLEHIDWSEYKDFTCRKNDKYVSAYGYIKEYHRYNTKNLEDLPDDRKVIIINKSDLTILFILNLYFMLFIFICCK